MHFEAGFCKKSRKSTCSNEFSTPALPPTSEKKVRNSVHKKVGIEPGENDHFSILLVFDTGQNPPGPPPDPTFSKFIGKIFTEFFFSLDPQNCFHFLRRSLFSGGVSRQKVARKVHFSKNVNEVCNLAPYLSRLGELLNTLPKNAREKMANP